LPSPPAVSARVEAGEDYPSDVLAGAALGHFLMVPLMFQYFSTQAKAMEAEEE
jgi:hypothetical protein